MMDTSSASSSHSMTLCLKRAYPFGSCYEPLRKAHLSDKENLLLRDPAAAAAIQQNTVRRLFAANNSKKTECNIGRNEQTINAKQRRVSFADNGCVRPLEPARRYSLSSPPPPAAAACSSCLDRQPVLVCRCALCLGQVCSRCKGVCARCAKETCQNCAYPAADKQQEEEVICADCNSLME